MSEDAGRWRRRTLAHGLGLLRYGLGLVREARRAAPRKCFLCLTVDGDGGGIDRAIDVAVPALFALYDQLGLRGRVSWFVNQAYQWTVLHAAALSAILARGDRVELHCHVEHLHALGDEEAMARVIAADKAAVEEACTTLKPSYRVRCFRSGKLDHWVPLYQTLEELGFEYDSSIGHRGMGRPSPQGRATLPPWRNCYYLKADFYKVPAPRPTQLVEVPVWEPYPDIAALRDGGDEPLVITSLVHPFNFVTPEGRLREPPLRYYRFVIGMLACLRNAEFAILLEAGEAWREAHR